jgi:ATP-binding cassette, subfamily B, bacterial MsbA
VSASSETAGTLAASPHGAVRADEMVLPGRDLVKRICLERKALLAGFLVFSLAYVVLEGLSLALLVPFLQSVLNAGASDRAVIGRGSFTLSGTVPVLAGVIFGVVALKNATDYLSRIQEMKLKEQVVERCRNLIFVRLMAQNLGGIYKASSGQYANILIGETYRAGLATHAVLKLVVYGLAAGVYILVLLVLAPWPTVALGLCCGLIYAANMFLFRRSRQTGSRITQAREELSSFVNDALQGMKVIRLYGREADEAARFRKVVARNTDADYNSGLAFAGIQPVTQLFVTAMLLGLVLAARYMFGMNMQASGPLVLAYLFILFRFLPLIAGMNAERSQYLGTKSGFVSVINFIDRTRHHQEPTGGRPFTGLTRSIRYEGVSFRYPEGPFELRDITFTIPAGSRVALAGPSGAGKSTIVDLMCGFYAPVRGTICIDDVPLTELDKRSWCRRLGVVSQETLLFNESVWFNVTYARPDASRDEVIEACRRAYCHDFIQALADGYETTIGERGVKLSGGQRQRLSIARAFLSNPEVLILDEATSALDQESEKLVKKAMEELMVGKTVIMIAHRSSTIRGVDQVLLFNQGRLVETGGHDELLKRDQLYQRLHAEAHP